MSWSGVARSRWAACTAVAVVVLAAAVLGVLGPLRSASSPVVGYLGAAAGGPAAVRADPVPPPCTGTWVRPGDDVRSAVAAAPDGTTICFAAGLYRLSAPLEPKQQQTLQAEQGAVLNGAIVLTGWAQDQGRWYAEGALPPDYTDPGFAPCEDQVVAPCKKAEQVFKENAQLRRVTSMDALVSGTFYSDYATGRVWIADDPAGADYEVSRARAAITSSAPGVSVSNFVVEKFATLAQHGAVEDYGDNWMITRNEFRFNHGSGVKVVAAGTVVSGNDVHHNGQLGISTYRATKVVVKDNRMAANNTDGFRINDGESGGIKVANSQGVTVSGNRVHANLGPGVWVDIDNQSIRILDNHIDDNASDGIRYEISYRGEIAGNALEANGLHRGRDTTGYLGEGGAITVNTSSDVAVHNNLLVSNDKGIALVKADRGGGELGPWDLLDVAVSNNTVVLVPGAETGIVVYVDDRSYFTGRGNTFQGNQYVLPGQDHETPAFRGVNNQVEPFSSWQASGYDVPESGATLSTVNVLPTVPPLDLPVGPH